MRTNSWQLEPEWKLLVSLWMFLRKTSTWRHSWIRGLFCFWVPGGRDKNTGAVSKSEQIVKGCVLQGESIKLWLINQKNCKEQNLKLLETMGLLAYHFLVNIWNLRTASIRALNHPALRNSSVFWVLSKRLTYCFRSGSGRVCRCRHKPAFGERN